MNLDERRSSLPAAALGLAMFLPAFGTHGLTANRAALAASLGLDGDDWRLALLMASFALAALVAYLVVGSFGDRRGLRRSLKLGVVGFLAAHLLLLTSAPLVDAFGWSRWSVFFVLRLAAGFAGGAITVSANALGAELYPPGQRGRSMSLVWLGVPLALVVGVPLPDYLDGVWQRASPEVRRWIGEPYTFTATIAAVVVAVLVPLALRRAPERSTPRSDASSTPLPRVASAWWAYTISFLMPFGVFPLIVSAETYTKQVFGLSSLQRGHLFLLLGVASVAGGVFSGAVADRIGRRRTLLLALGLFALLVPLLPSCSPWPYRVLAALLGFVSTIRQGPFQALASLLADPGGRGRLSARILVSSQIGISLGQAAGVLLVRTSSGADASLVTIAIVSTTASALAWLLARRFQEAKAPELVGARA